MAVQIFPKNDVYELAYLDGSGVFAYGFAPTDDEQRWVILTRDKAKFPPRQAVRLQKTNVAGWKDISSWSKFKDFVYKKDAAGAYVNFDVNAHYYVKAKLETYANASSLPRPMPQVDWLDGFTFSSQPDIGTAQLVAGTTVTGYVQTFFHGAEHSREFWVLFNGYNADLNPGNEIGHIRSPEQFADLIDQKSWNTESTLVSVSCAYLKSLPTAQ